MSIVLSPEERDLLWGLLQEQEDRSEPLALLLLKLCYETEIENGEAAN